MRKRAILRIRIITGIILCLALVLIGRLYYLQVSKHDYYLAKAEEQYVYTVQGLYSRGSIFFTPKQGDIVSAATITSGYELAVNPKQIVDAESVYFALEPYIDVDRDTFVARAQLTGRTYVPIVNQVPTKDVESIKSLDISGVQLRKEQWRYYPGQELASRVVGFVGYSTDETEGLRGRYGLERYYDDVLYFDTNEKEVNFFAEIFTNLGQVLFDSTPTRSGDIVTTIEPTVARMLDEELAQIQEDWGSTLTGGIIIHPQTGEIYAMNAVPTFDLNTRASATLHMFRNPLVESVYEMGSIIKPLTVAAGLDAGAITPASTYYDAGKIELDTYTIRNYDGGSRGQVSMQEVLNQSLNTGVAYIVDKIGKDNFREYFLNLRLGSETGIDLPNEAHGLINNLQSPRDVEYATASFGQGIALTPIATVRALATLANGGRLITPHLVSEIRYQDGSQKESKWPDGERVYSAQTSETISQMLTKVVDDALQNGDVRKDRYSIAAKTGTAQIANSEAGGYFEDKFLHSFFGYFPSYDPQFLVFLYTVEPQDVRYASETLTEPFMNITDFLINYYNLPPDR